MKKSRLVISILAAIFGIVSIFVLLAKPFVTNYGINSGYLVIFGQDNWPYNTVSLLVVAWIVELLCIIIPFVAPFIGKKGGKIVFGVTAVLDIAAGILMLLAVQLFFGANEGKLTGLTAADYGLGPAFISNAVMAFISAAICLIGLVLVNKED